MDHRRLECSFGKDQSRRESGGVIFQNVGSATAAVINFISGITRQKDTNHLLHSLRLAEVTHKPAENDATRRNRVRSIDAAVAAVKNYEGEIQ